MSKFPQIPPDRLFNSPLEVGLRTLIVLTEVGQSCDLQRLTIYDYLLLHSGDLKDGPESLHPPSPFRSGELLVKRVIIEKGLSLLCTKGLTDRSFDDTGIKYAATEVARPFLDYFDSNYARRARSIATWIGSTFQNLDDQELQTVIGKQFGQWGSEFVGETMAEEDFQ